MHTLNQHLKRVAIGVVGTTIVLAGLVMIPYPGPGWLVVFAGLATLATEFHWAQNVLASLRRRYDAWTTWLKQSHWGVQMATTSCTAVVVVGTIWVMNGYGVIDNAFGLGYDWAHSPLTRRA